MRSVGVIANPASGKDIRRLVAHASVFDNQEKINILQRVLLALDAMGVSHVYIMPDYYGLGVRANDGLSLSSLHVGILDLPVTATQQDSTAAAALFCEMNVSCIVTLGGDGTNRVVAKGCGDVPIIPVSTGTNNVFPMMVEGTIAGLAAALIAGDAVDTDRVVYRAKRLEVYFDGDLVDIALIDVVTTSELWVGTRAIWDPTHIREVVLARAEPGCIGLSSIGSCFRALGARDELGMYLALGEGGMPVLAPLGPGLVSRVAVHEPRLLSPGDEVTLQSGAGTLALDGERQIEIYAGQKVRVRLTTNGPRVVDIHACMDEASRTGVFLRHELPRRRE